MAHQGVALDDPRNRAILGFLKPPVLTALSISERLGRIHHSKPPANLAEKVAWIMSHPKGAPKPPSQSLASVANPLDGLGTHPDLVTRLWKLNEALPEDCRWVVYGRPALVHPLSGTIFAYASGTLGYAIRLPEPCRGEADR